jgi:hypothetical protein
MADAKLLSTFTEEGERSASQQPTTRRSRNRQQSTWPDNTNGRRPDNVPVQGVPNASKASRENVREETAVEVVAGAEEAQGQGEHVNQDEADAGVTEQVIEDNQEDDRDHVDA